MKLVSEINIVFSEVNVTMTSGDLVQLECFPSSREASVVSFPFNGENVWTDLITLSTEASLWDVLDPNVKDHLRFLVLNKDKVLLGEASVTFRENWSLSGSNKSFRAFIKKSGVAVGELTGVLKYISQPCCAQMSGGKLTDNGVVSGGKLLYPGLPYPAYFDEEPEALPITHKTVEDEKYSGAVAFVPTAPPLVAVQAVSPPVSVPTPTAAPTPPLGVTYSSKLNLIPLPPSWEMRLEKLTGRPFFADHRVRLTCWEDPRFLPENWDQRIDPKTGKVYFAYHKTKATTFIDPRYMPKGWEMRLDTNAKVHYAHHVSRQTTFTDPRGMPSGVAPSLDQTGRMYFLNHMTKSTSWDDPRKGQTQQVILRWKADEQRAWLEQEVTLALSELTDEQSAERNEAQ